ncbi:response regulator transcription factor [Kribbella sp. HUAS MG21]|jgi:DNA-binding NarL/FixJ family response regulator|uniref:Response regulator transcription factor n=1 Tax=Kribbella sp. HUAS MG21 TaxID=3160966 RepID=A0AAU7T7S2_9ACTN
MAIKVFLLDDHEVVRLGLQRLLEAEPDIEIVGDGATATEAIARIPAVRPDVALLDVRLPDGDGVTVCREIRSAMEDPPACLMLTSFSDDDALFAAIMAGAAGYLLKQIDGEDLVKAVRRLAVGDSLLDPAMTTKVLERLRHPAAPEDPRYAALTEQEKEILGLVAEGKTNRQIAQALYLAEKTVKNHVSAVLRKLHFERRTEAAIFAVEHAKNHPPT